MKRILNFISAIAILSIVFVFLAGSGNMYMATGVTVGVGAFAAIMHSKQFKGLAFDIITIPDFTAKTEEEVKALSDDDYVSYKKLEKEFEVATMKKYFMDELNKKISEGNSADKEAMTKLQATLETISKEHITWGEELNALKEQNDSFIKTHEGQIHKWIEENADEIVKLKAAGSGLITFKAVGAIATTSATNPDGIPAIVGVQQAAPTNVLLRGTIVEPLITIFPTNQAAFAYTESVPKDGDYSFVAEKGSKPQIDFKIETQYAQPVKAAAHEILTDEALKDIPNLQSIATDFLRKKHDLKKENGILFGDGISPNPKGATVYGRSFVPGDLADTVPSPNIMDVINACITDIFVTHNFTDEMPYMANMAMINPIDFFVQFVAAKDNDGLPLFPTASLFNRVTLGGVTIIPFENIPSGRLFVADMKKYNTTRYVEYRVKIGWINNQLITNQFTMVGESRFHAFVKNLDEQAFIYDFISIVKNSLDPAS